MRFLLNTSTHKNNLLLAGGRWEKASRMLDEAGFDGFELYPVGNYDYGVIPEALISGIHLRFFVMLEQIWQRL